MKPSALISSLFLALTLPSLAGEYFRMDAPISPGERLATLHGYQFHDQKETLRVVHPGNTKLPPWKTLGEAFSSSRALAGINASPASADGQPLGLIISDSTTIGKLDTTAPNTAAIVLVKWNHIAIKHAAHCTEADLLGATQAFQAGPFLIEDGKPVANLDTKSYSRRSILLTSGNGDWAILYAPSSTLQGLASLLSQAETFTRFKVATAINLDGGLSSSFWVHLPAGGSPVYLREVNPVKTGIAVVRE